MQGMPQQTFNHDLLLHDVDRKLAKERFPAIWHVLDHERLREHFEKYDVPANMAKRHARVAGFLAILLGSGALVSASAEHLIDEGSKIIPEGISSHLPESIISFVPSTAVVLAFVAAAAGLASVAIGALGLLYAGKKAEWLQKRLMTERTRQFFFQTLAFRIPEIATSLSGDAGVAEFRKKREEWFEAFVEKFEHNLAGEYAKSIQEDADEDYQLHRRRNNSSRLQNYSSLDQLFDAYEALRFEEQYDYASMKLKYDYKILSNSPRRQSSILAMVALLCLVGLCLVHLGVVIGALSPTAFWANFRSEFANVTIIWIAIIALAIRAIEEGLQPEREIERYQQYRAAVRSIRRRFANAQSQAEKIKIMQEMERLSFQEMCNFLITNDRARFVM